MKILIIRHGESEADLLDVHEGRADFPLTEKGVQQAEKMAQYVHKHFPELEEVYASPLKRAAKTAEILSETVNIPLTFKDDLMEMDNGKLKGLSREEARRRFPEPKNRALHEPIPGGESLIEFRARAEKVFSEIMKDAREKDRSFIGIVSHGGTISQIFHHLFNLPYRKYGFYTGDTGMHLIEVSKRVIVRFMNKTEHLHW